MTRPWKSSATFVALLLLAACSSSSSADETAAGTEGTVAAAEVATTVTTETTAALPETAAAPPETTGETTAEAAAPEWELVAGDETCMCADGSEFNLYVREADPTKVVLYFQGGGACFSGEMCRFDSDSYNVNLAGDGDPGQYGGIFDLENSANPFADWSFVFVPYCTGDVHLGDNTQDYGDGLVVEHNGIPNAMFALDELQRRYPDATELFVAGSSAGGVPAPLFAGLASDRYPDAAITALADGSGAYPDVPGINAAVGALWGTYDARPDWPETAALTPEDWSIPGLFSVAGAHDPDIVMARHDHAFDSVQASFSAAAGIDASNLVALIDENVAGIESTGVPVAAYVAPGTAHTILGRDQLYTQEVEGVALIDWLTDLVERRPVTDVHCTTCE